MSFAVNCQTMKSGILHLGVWLPCAHPHCHPLMYGQHPLSFHFCFLSFIVMIHNFEADIDLFTHATIALCYSCHRHLAPTLSTACTRFCFRQTASFCHLWARFERVFPSCWDLVVFHASVACPLATVWNAVFFTLFSFVLFFVWGVGPDTSCLCSRLVLCCTLPGYNLLRWLEDHVLWRPPAGGIKLFSHQLPQNVSLVHAFSPSPSLRPPFLVPVWRQCSRGSKLWWQAVHFALVVDAMFLVCCLWLSLSYTWDLYFAGIFV